MKKYESVFILDIRKVEQDGADFSKELDKLIRDLGGKVEEAVSMGRKQFAREINKRKAGIYWNVIFELDPANVIKIKDNYKLDERILRILIVNYDRPEPREEVDEEDRPAQTAESNKTGESDGVAE